MNGLKELRIRKKLTQWETAELLGVSLRSYISYENEERKAGTPKYRFLMQELERLDPLDEDHGILTLADIKAGCAEVFAGYRVEFCWLFGSYAKGTPKESSDVDLVIAADEEGLRYYELAERLRETLRKRIDLLDIKQLTGNEALLREVLREGIRIYEQPQE